MKNEANGCFDIIWDSVGKNLTEFIDLWPTTETMLKIKNHKIGRTTRKRLRMVTAVNVDEYSKYWPVVISAKKFMQSKSDVGRRMSEHMSGSVPGMKKSVLVKYAYDILCIV